MRPLPRSLRDALAGDGRGLGVLVVRLGALGDILRTLPAVRLLRFTIPEARVEWVCDDRWAAFLARHRDLDAVVPFPRAATATKAIRAIREAHRALRGGRYDLVVDFHGNLRSGVVAAWTGSPVRVGFASPQAKEANRLFSTHRIDPLPLRSPRRERNLALVRSLGVPTDPIPDPGLEDEPYAAAAAHELADGLAGPGEPYAVVNPGASVAQAYKRPPCDLLVAAVLTLERHDVPSIVVWGPGEQADAEAVVERAPGPARLAPRTSLAVLQALLRNATCAVSGDTGPLHLACAVGCPVVAIYGPTDPEVNAPWGVPFVRVAPGNYVYSGVKRRDRIGGRFEDIDRTDVTAAIDALVERCGIRRRVAPDGA